MPGVLNRLLAGESLTAGQAEAVLDLILDEGATPAQIAAFMVALRVKGETVEEMTGMVRALLAHARPCVVAGEVVDLVGTGGDRLASINVTTLAAFITAGAGVKVCKHGNRAASSSVGTADVLEALGVAIDLDGPGVDRCVAEAGMGFCLAPAFHPALKTVGPVRRELGIPTVFNFLGPLANPAGARRQLVGVSDPAMAPKMAGVLGATGSRRAMVLFADDGLDELSVTGPATVIELEGDGEGDYDLVTSRVDPAALGFAPATLADLRGGDAAFNAEAIRRVLDGAPGPHRDIGVLNAAAALVVAGAAPDLPAGIAAAGQALDEGRARAVLDALVTVSAAAAAAG
jgi:anthranilate phosphoribosyltransferase